MANPTKRIYVTATEEDAIIAAAALYEATYEADLEENLPDDYHEINAALDNVIGKLRRQGQ